MPGTFNLPPTGLETGDGLMRLTIESLISDADIPLDLNTQSITIVRNIRVTEITTADIHAMFTKTYIEVLVFC